MTLQTIWPVVGMKNQVSVVFDSQCFDNQSTGGIRRYFENLLLRLPELDCAVTLPALAGSARALSEMSRKVGPKPQPEQHRPGSRWRNPLLHRLQAYGNRFAACRMVSQERNFVFHPTYFRPYFLRRLPSYVPLVVTVFDLIHERFPHFFLKRDPAANKERLLSRADAIIAISETTRNDLIEHYRLPASKIEVIYLGSTLQGDAEQIERGATSQRPPYLLFVGNRGGYKNFGILLAALRILPEFILVAAGGPAFSKEEAHAIEKYGCMGRVEQVPEPTDRTLMGLYKDAFALVCPSLYEGFGLPVVEAMNLSCPVLASNRGSLPEVAGDAALYFEPESAEEIANQVNALTSADQRQKLIAAGARRSGLYCWTQTAVKHVALYRRLVP